MEISRWRQPPNLFPYAVRLGRGGEKSSMKRFRKGNDVSPLPGLMLLEPVPVAFATG
jgi:hypothetical protein